MQCFDFNLLDEVLCDTRRAVILPHFRTAIAQIRTTFSAAFFARQRILPLLTWHTQALDGIVLRVWRWHRLGASANLSLIALGGYGRGQMYPFSDLDLSIVYPLRLPTEEQQRIEAFWRFLWDLQLRVGNSQRSFHQSCVFARHDAQFATALLESRLLCGDRWLFRRLHQYLRSTRCWTHSDFLQAKLDEQRARHHRFHDATHSLEPNIKSSPGGLRDLHILGWLAKRFFAVYEFFSLVRMGYLDGEEYIRLSHAHRTLAWFRCGIQLLSKRADDRLLFSRQEVLAKIYSGLQKPTESRALQQRLMRRYYRTASAVSSFNELLLRDFSDHILRQRWSPQEPEIKLEGLVVQHQQLVLPPEYLPNQVHWLFKIFVILARHSQYILSTDTIRLLYRYRALAGRPNFRRNPDCQRLFIELLSIRDCDMGAILQLMQRCGILQHYLPAFARISGQSQYDPIHHYTIDTHTLRALSALRQLSTTEKKTVKVAQVYAALPDLRLLHIALLFHDLGKGRQRDHCLVGQRLAGTFCRDHGLNDRDRKLVMWLVRHHLHLALNAERVDVEDPEKIMALTRSLARDRLRLEYLYVLTVADMISTAKGIWNSWHAALLQRLYQRLRSHSFDDNQVAHRITRQRRAAIDLLSGFAPKQVQALWSRLPKEYFMHHVAEQIAWHTTLVIGAPQRQHCALRVFTDADGLTNTYELFLYTQDCLYLFVHICRTLQQLHLRILRANITATCDHYTWDSFLVVSDEKIPSLKRMQHTIEQLLHHRDRTFVALGAITAREAYFTTQVEVRDRPTHTLIEVITADRSGLLVWLGNLFQVHAVFVHKAQIVTHGMRTTNLFNVATAKGTALSAALSVQLREEICAGLDRERVAGLLK